jgi:chemotaxis protein histidine kinase CheA
MTLDPELLDQAYHLFVEEALELLQQIQEALLELPRDRSLAKTHSLVRAASTIKSGAAQVNLTDIHTLAHRLENIFRSLWQEKIFVDFELEELLWQAYECLRLSLVAQIQTKEERVVDTLIQAEPVFSQLEAILSPKLNAEIERATFDEPEEDKMEWLLNQEVAQALEALETLLSNPEAPNLSEALKAQVEVFLSLGELLEVSEFVAVAQITLATLQVSPQSASTIGQLTLAGFRGVWQKQGNFKTNSGVETSAVGQLLELQLEDNEKAFSPMAAAEEPLPEKSRSRQVTEIVKANLPIASELTLKTAKSLVWLTGSTAFILPCDRVREIVLPQANQVVCTEGQPCLYWKNSTIPVYRLWELLQHNSFFGKPAPPSSSSVPLLVVLDHPGQTFAIELTVDRLISVPELIIKPFGRAIAPPGYCYGCTLMEGDRLVVVIDLESLLTQVLEITPITPVPTILAIDDSNTSRQILVLILEKAGYQVIQARDGLEGIEQMRQNPTISLVVSDIEMPKLNGFGFLQSCRQDPQLAKVPVVLLSSYSTLQHRQLAMESGAAAYFSKPLDEEEFLDALSTIVKQKIVC